MKIAICDDDKNDLRYIHKVISESLVSKNINGEFNLFLSSEKLLDENKKSKFDVIFLDLDMPETDGMKVASYINKLNESTEIIFVTNHDELVYKAYKFKALGFIRKKFLEAEIDEVMDALIENINMNHQYIVFNDSEQKYTISDIIFMKSDDHYVDIVTNSAKYSIRESLNNIERSYSCYGFIRIHSRYLVNYRYLYSIEKNTVVLIDQRQLPMSRSRSSTVKEAFQFFSRRIL